MPAHTPPRKLYNEVKPMMEEPGGRPEGGTSRRREGVGGGGRGGGGAAAGGNGGGRDRPPEGRGRGGCRHETKVTQYKITKT